mmetsp:Transcript_4643/g.7204  ORF Transcript_4643/g.7204 Transcript_4643/m.7204 type:complete len:209 (+) Transcript_4643:1386-2012(+)
MDPCQIQGGFTTFRTSLQINASLRQILHHFQMAGPTGQVQRSPSIVVHFQNYVGILNVQIVQGSQITHAGHSKDVARQQLPSLGILLSPSFGPIVAGKNVGWETDFQTFERIFVEFQIGIQIFVVFPTKGTEWFEMNKDVGKVPTLHGKRTAMQHGMAFVQDHITWFHGNIVRNSIVSPNFQGPGFINVLCDIDNGRRDEWIPIDVGR